MRKSQSSGQALVFLGIEAGGTRTVALEADEAGALRKRIECGPANLRLITPSELIQLFQGIAGRFASPSAVGIGMAGVRDRADEERILRAAARVWPGTPCAASHDLETALAAAESGPGTSRLARVIVLSGTGSCCFGRASCGTAAKVGGWGHLLGDRGSGYEIGLQVLRSIIFHYDRKGVWPALGERILRHLQLNEPNDLIAWAQGAGKKEIAALTPEVFNGARERDAIARGVLDEAAAVLARDASACARRLEPDGGQVRFVLTGSVLLKQPHFSRKVARLIRNEWPDSPVGPLRRESVWGAVELARREWKRGGGRVDLLDGGGSGESADDSAEKDGKPRELTGLALSPTEERNPNSMNLDKMSLGGAMALMLREEDKVSGAIRRQLKPLEQLIRAVAASLKSGGRLFYAGAGTSGRLGVLDASECPPTFRSPPEQVQGIIAGGQQALWRAVEGAEDDAEAGARAVDFRGVKRGDVVLGIAASGRTPFVWGVLAEAERRGAKTGLLCFNPRLILPARPKLNWFIAPDVGPEVLTGSTRLKCGTATKRILNMVTTLAMVRLGKAASNLMVDLNPSNTKLRDRAARIVSELTGRDAEEARLALERSGWVVSAALKALHHGAKKI